MEIKFNGSDFPFSGMTIKFLRSRKILVVPDGSGFHFTLHPGNTSGNIDIHRTDERLSQGDAARYETLVTVSREDIVEKVQRLGTGHVRKLPTLLRPIRIGWMAHRRLGVVGLPTEAEVNKVSTIRLTLDPVVDTQLLRSWMRTPEFLEEILELPNETFQCSTQKDALASVWAALPS
jgi:hypothetical protein